jgi:hypothetical protein
LKYYQNKFVYILIFIITFFLIYLYHSSKRITLHKNYELRNIEILVSANNDYLELLNNKLNQYDDLIWYSYIDDSDDIKLYNSLKEKPINQLLLYEYLLSKPTIESILEKFLKMQNSPYDFIEYNRIFVSFINQLFLYIKSLSIDENIGDVIFANLLNKNSHINNNFHKIIIKSNKNFSNQFELIDDYQKLYKFINNLDSKNSKIISIKFYDRFLYDNYIDIGDNNIQVSLDECILCYSTSISDLQGSIIKLNSLEIEYDSNSMLDFIVTNEIKGDKYKIINKILINASNFEDINQYKTDYSTFIELLKDIENIAFNLEKFNDSFDDSIYKLKVIIDFFENDKNNYKYYYNLVDSYNRSIYDNIKYIANTEKFSEDKLSLFIYNDYYRDNNYVSRFFIPNNHIKLLESAFDFNTSNQRFLK